MGTRAVSSACMIFINGDTLLGSENRGAHPTAIERRGADLGKAGRHLAEVGVFLHVINLVIAFNGSQEVVFRLAFKAELIRQLLDGVGLHHETVCHLGLELVLELRAALHRCRAANSVEALRVLKVVGVMDLGVHTAGLIGRSVADVVVGAALVGKSLAIAVHLEERLRTGLVLATGSPFR